MLKVLKNLQHNVVGSTKLIKSAISKKQTFFMFFKITSKLSLLFNIKKKYKKLVIEKRVLLFRLGLNQKKANQKNVQSRLDFLIHRVYFCKTIFLARHLVKKGFVFVNNKPIFYYNYRVKAKDFVFVNIRLEKDVVPIFFEHQQLRLAVELPSNVETSFSSSSFIKIS